MNPIHDIYKSFEDLKKAEFKCVETGFGACMEWIRSDLPDLPLFTCLIQLSGTDEGHISDDTIWKALYTNAEEFKKLAKYGTTCPVLSLSKSSMDGPRALRVPRGSGEGLKSDCPSSQDTAC